MQPRPSARIGEGPPTNITSKRQPGVAGKYSQDPQARSARNRPPPPAAISSQEWRAAALRDLILDWQGSTHHLQRRAPARNGEKLRPGPTARICRGPPTATSSRLQPGMAGNCTQEHQPQASAGESGDEHQNIPHAHTSHAHAHQQTRRVQQPKQTTGTSTPTQTTQIHKARESKRAQRSTHTPAWPRHQHT